jgi:hydroxyethylthiazole kinase-like uncharacterized protein yjeF
MKVFSAAQIKTLDAYTIKHEPIASIDLMERAALVFTDWFTNLFTNKSKAVHLFCGPGNNGGDGLAIARMLHFKGYEANVYLAEISPHKSADYQENLQRLPRHEGISTISIQSDDPLPAIPPHGIIIDAMLGAGLNRPLSRYWEMLAQHLNNYEGTRIAVDIPSGMFADRLTDTTSFMAHHTFSFEAPKLAFFMPEHEGRVGQWHIGTINLHPRAIATMPTPYFYVDEAMVNIFIQPRPKFGHKGTFGHCLLLAGSYGKMGAAVLASIACLRSGVGLLSVHIPECGYDILQSSVPEAMVSIDPERAHISTCPDLSQYKSIGIGCGIGQQGVTAKALHQLLVATDIPLVLDADALNIIAQQPDWLPLIPQNSILTPHPREFERLFGATNNQFERIELLRAKSHELGLNILLKGAHTCIATPSGICYFNSTGNPGMGTAGSGDVLTGIIAGLLAQGYAPNDAAVLGVYIHGLAGDMAAQQIGQEALIARDLISYLGQAFLSLTAT